jgi:hypothetical protein
MNYAVPDFGPDHEIAASHAHEAAASATLGHAWNPDKDDDGNSSIHPDAHEKTLVGQKAEINLNSDHNCNSYECYTKHAFPSKKEKEPVEY